MSVPKKTRMEFFVEHYNARNYHNYECNQDMLITKMLIETELHSTTVFLEDYIGLLPNQRKNGRKRFKITEKICIVYSNWRKCVPSFWFAADLGEGRRWRGVVCRKPSLLPSLILCRRLSGPGKSLRKSNT